MHLCQWNRKSDHWSPKIGSFLRIRRRRERINQPSAGIGLFSAKPTFRSRSLSRFWFSFTFHFEQKTKATERLPLCLLSTFCVSPFQPPIPFRQQYWLRSPHWHERELGRKNKNKNSTEAGRPEVCSNRHRMWWHHLGPHHLYTWRRADLVPAHAHLAKKLPSKTTIIVRPECLEEKRDFVQEVSRQVRDEIHSYPN